MKLEEKLVSLRKAKGLSQMKLAEKMNVSRQAMTVEKDAEIWVMKSSDLGESWSTVQSLQ